MKAKQAKALDDLEHLIDELLTHVAEMGCTCVDRSEGHQKPCTGFDLMVNADRRAKKLLRALRVFA
jgi:hypothetical protein